MSKKYPTVSAKELFICINPRHATEEERWQGLPAIIPGYRPCADAFLNHLLSLIHRYGNKEASFYAEKLELETKDLNSVVYVLTDTRFAEFLVEYSLLMACDLLAHTDMDIKTVASRCGYSRSGLFRAFIRNYRISPTRWRLRHR
ncbi:AraC family transcriptional regulator [Parabacteroides sp. OttesenSCG-928-G07]|nr:AraC family transcriptional regulator [Parabacteroides sp. OttesenSCG-928-G07]